MTERPLGHRGVGWAVVCRRAADVLSLLGVAALCLEWGFEQPVGQVGLLEGAQWVAIGAHLLVRGVMVGAGGVRRRRWWVPAGVDLVLLVFVGVLVALDTRPLAHGRGLAAGYIGAVRLFQFCARRLAVAESNLRQSTRPIQPAVVLAGTFGGLILLGTVLLSLPMASSAAARAAVAGNWLTHGLNCLFTSTSATCVTGLVVYDTGADFSRFGQVVILVLIQIGGLGIMIFGSLFGLLVGRQLSLRESLILQDAGSHRTIGEVRSMVRFIVLSTFSIELVGVWCLYGLWPAEMADGRERLFYSVFHAVSAFCNAGFSLQPDSLVGFRTRVPLYGCVMPLIVLGGLGFPVLRDLFGLLRFHVRGWAQVAGRWIRGERLAAAGSGSAGRRRYRISLHTKLVLCSSGALIVLGAVGFFAFESVGADRLRASAAHGADAVGATGAALLAAGDSNVMANLPIGERLGAAVFRSVTTRTAGFNASATDLASVTTASHFLMCLLMFIGGSPASTAGGAKTTAVAALVLGVVATLRQRKNIEVFQRSIPELNVRRAAVVVFLMFVLVSAVTMALCVTEDARLAEVLFESVSACGTVGLSTGLTPELTGPGRVIIMLAMFAGRIGPLTLLATLAGGRPPARYEYPADDVLIG